MKHTVRMAKIIRTVNTGATLRAMKPGETIVIHGREAGASAIQSIASRLRQKEGVDFEIHFNRVDNKTTVLRTK